MKRVASLLEIQIITQVFFLRTIMLLQYVADMLYANFLLCYTVLKSLIKGNDLIKSIIFGFFNMDILK